MKKMKMLQVIKNRKLLYICLLIMGAMVISAGVMLNPPFVSKYLSPDGTIDKLTVIKIYILESLVVIIGLGICLYSLLKLNRSVLAEKIDEKIEKHIILRWNRYWFAPTPLRRLAIFRILIFGFLLFMSLFLWIPGYIERLKDVAPEFFNPLIIIRILHLNPPSPFVVDTVHFLLTLFAAGAMVGFMTRFCILGSLTLFLYIIGMWWSFEGVHRSVSPAFIFAMFALLLSPCGKVLSIDGMLARKRDLQNLQKGAEFQQNRAEKSENEYALWPIRLTQVIIAFIYFNAGYWKLKFAGLSWAEGVTMQYYLIDHNLRGDSISDIGLLISQYPMLCSALSILTLVWELGFPIILVFPRLAWIFLPLGVSFHLGTGITMATWFYPLWFCYIAFIDFEAVGPWVKEKIKFFRDSFRPKILFD